MVERTDNELIERARQGDKEAFGVLTHRYLSSALRLAVRLVSREDLAQDLAQEAMMQAYLSLDRLRQPDRFKSWLYGIVLNLCRSYLRRREFGLFSLEAIMEGRPQFALPLYDLSLPPERVAENNELHSIVLAAVNALPPRDRDATLLFYYARLNLREIAVIQGVSLNAVKVRLHRARRRLKDILLAGYPEILTAELRRKKMIKVTVADVIAVENKEGQELPVTPYAVTPYIIVLYDEAGRRLLPIWIGPHEGECIAIGLTDFATPRPLTYNFFSSLLQGINGRLEEVCVVSLKNNTFYAVVKMRCGKKTSEIDARPSDAIALAVLNDSPILVAEDVLESAGVPVPGSVKGRPARRGVAKIIKANEEWLRQYQSRLSQDMKKHREISEEDKAGRIDEFIASIFGK